MLEMPLERERAVQERTAQESEVKQVRERIRELTSDLEVLTDTVHRDEVARAEQRLRIESLENKGLEDFGVDPDTLVGCKRPSPAICWQSFEWI